MQAIGSTMMNAPDIAPPIFLVGTSRSGKSLLGSFLALHKDTCWFSNYSDKVAQVPLVSACHRMIDWPVLGVIVKKSIISQQHYKFLPRPVEGERIYHKHCGLTKARVTDINTADMKKQQLSCQMLKASVAAHIKFHGKKRFISDQSSNTQRIGLIRSIFPNAYIIHVIRDGRAVSSELIRRKWWKNHRPWWYDRTPLEWVEEGKEPITMCGVHWLKTVSAVLEDKENIGEQYLEVRYEELVKNPLELLRRVALFCQLDWYPELEEYLPQYIENHNNHWKKGLTERQKVALQKTLSTFLSTLGYRESLS